MAGLPDDPKAQIDVPGIRALVLSSNTSAQVLFQEHHGALVDRAVQGVHAALTQLDRFRARVVGDNLAATLELFFHAALNSVLTAAHHLISGYPISAGNMMRHHTEAVAMSLLCLDNTSGVLERFSADRRSYPVHDAPHALRNKKRRDALERLIAFDATAWETILKLARLYDQLSHSSALALAHHLQLATPNGMILGSEYDPAKETAYIKDLRRIASAAEVLAHLIRVVTDKLVADRRGGEPHESVG